jgi:hypothetical protein
VSAGSLKVDLIVPHPVIFYCLEAAEDFSYYFLLSEITDCTQIVARQSQEFKIE